VSSLIQRPGQVGRLIATGLAGSWREPPLGSLLSADELAAITPVAIKAASGPLLWRRIRNTSLADSECGKQLQNLYRLHRLEARIHRHKIRTILESFDRAGIDSLMMKGWSVERLYPEPGLRHYNDLDLCVSPKQWRSARKTLNSLGPLGSYVDLHRGLGRHENVNWFELVERAETVDLDGMPVKVLGAEHHLRLLCLHWLRHGGWSPSGLCDVAVTLEARRLDFDWEIVLGPNKKRADWVACTVGLAHHLLGANVTNTPMAGRARNLPRWLVPAVMRQWQSCINPNYRDIALAELRPFLRNPKRLAIELSDRWSHPIRATVEVGGQFSDNPRGPYQLAALLLRSPELPRQIAMLASRRIQSLFQRHRNISIT